MLHGIVASSRTVCTKYDIIRTCRLSFMYIAASDDDVVNNVSELGCIHKVLCLSLSWRMLFVVMVMFC